MGVKLASAGMMGPGFTGPLGLVVSVAYRFYEMCKNKKIWNRDKSNWVDKESGKFLASNLIPLAGNFLPNLCALVCLSLAFKYAAISGLNQGILPTLTSLAAIYCAILFYIKFSEMVSNMQILGMGVMMVSVVFLGLEGSDAAKRTAEEQHES